MLDQGSNRSDKGWRGVQGALDRLTDRLEETLDRAADAVERGMAGFERRMEDFERKVDEAVEGEAPVRKPAGYAARPKPTKDTETVTPEPGASAAEPSPGEEIRGGATGSGGGDGKEGDGETGPGFAKRMSEGYAAFVEKARVGVSGAVSRGVEAVDGVAGERPWHMIGMDGRRTRIAREVMREVVPKVAGDRVASVIDGAAMKGGVAGAGLLLRVPLKGFAVPFLLGITAVETVRAVRDVRASVADVAARVDNEARSAEIYASGQPGS